ncbi:MAG: exonuclease domain-containing protein [Oscillospiraceae bacterium]|nr:exonuclease domain-containing protein [Oscillospiraceae bacterium]
MTSESLTDFVVFDIETTGLRSEDEILEIGALKVRDGEVSDVFSSFIRPRRPIPPSTTIFNGITNSMVKDAEPVESVLAEFFDFVGGDVVMGHNIAAFDIPFIRRYAGVAGDQFARLYLDTLMLAKQKAPQIGRFNLESICKYYGIEMHDQHRAVGDCYATFACYQKLIETGDKGLFDVPAQKVDHKSPRFWGTQYCDNTVALQELHVLLMEITADRAIDAEEVLMLRGWLEKHQSLSGQYPYDKIIGVVREALEDGELSADELDNMLHLFLNCINPVEKSEHHEVCLSGKCICVSGEFAFGGRDAVKSHLESHGAIWKDSVTKKTEVLIVGDQGSTAYACGSYGGKIKRAMEFREAGCAIEIILESKLKIFSSS